MTERSVAAGCREALRGLDIYGLGTGREDGRGPGGGPLPAHAGLVFQRYYCPTTGERGKAVRQHLEGVARCLGRVGTLYALAFKRYEGALSGAVTRRFTVDGRLAIGLGTPSPTEVGIRLHHTYGTPIIPGSGLKGLAAHYHRQEWEDASSHEVLFGTTEDAGHIIFHDAWIVPESLDGSVVLDVITVHHQDYYAGTVGSAPTDFDEPVPVPFLGVRGTFLVAVEADVPGAEGRAWAELAMTLLTEAFERWGVGAKTSSGYGRLLPAAAGGQSADAGPAPVKRPEPAGAGSAGMTYRRGDRVRVRRVEDPKGKGRLWFRIVQGPGEGTVLAGGTPREVGVGEECDLVVASVGGTINFAWPDNPVVSKDRR